MLKPRIIRQTELLMPNSTVSIRGTGFYVNADVSKPHDYICCYYGHIEFQNSNKGEEQRLKNSYHYATTKSFWENFDEVHATAFFLKAVTPETAFTSINVPLTLIVSVLLVGAVSQSFFSN